MSATNVVQDVRAASADPIILRVYRDADEHDAIALWQRTWQLAYPDIDFAARLPWWRTRWRDELVAQACIVVAEDGDGGLCGFVTVDPKTRYLDQLVVAPECWGTDTAGRLMAAARALSPAGLELLVNADNARALAFYLREGFAETGTESNPRSGAPLKRLAWMPRAASSAA